MNTEITSTNNNAEIKIDDLIISVSKKDGVYYVSLKSKNTIVIDPEKYTLPDEKSLFKRIFG